MPSQHPAERDGAAAGRAAAIEDKHGGYGRGVGAELVLAARESADDWLAGNPRFDDVEGQSRQAYVDAFIAAYDGWIGWLER